MATADDVLRRFVDRLERRPERSRKLSEKPPAFDDLDERDAFDLAMCDAAKAGAVVIERGTRSGAEHHMQRIVLADPVALHRLLGIAPLADRVAAAMAGLRAVRPVSPQMADVLAAFETGWSASREAFGFRPGDADAVDFVRALDAVLRRNPADPRFLRTYSRQVAGHSKHIENHIGRITRYLQDAGRLPPELSPAEALAALGLERCPQPVLVAGPIAVGGTDLTALPWIGLPPETIASWLPTAAVRSVLTVENLTSFHLHVRDARQPGDIVIYSGGFPSRSVLRAIRTAGAWQPEACFHWGDIDPSGVLIPVHIMEQTGLAVRPHMMAPELALAHGEARPPHPRAVGAGTPFADLGVFLASPQACHMEQEETPPEPVCQASHADVEALIAFPSPSP